MNTERKNQRRQTKRAAYRLAYINSKGSRCGRPDDMRPATDWRETFKQMGYVPCL